MPLGKLSFLHMRFLKNDTQINKNSYRTTFFMSKKVSLPQPAQSCKKLTSAQKAISILFARNLSIVTYLLGPVMKFDPSPWIWPNVLGQLVTILMEFHRRHDKTATVILLWISGSEYWSVHKNRIKSTKCSRFSEFYSIEY